jgi:DNA-binding NarL/FixJ family response regulator
LVQKLVPAHIIEVADSADLMVQAQEMPPPDAMILDLIFPGFDGATSIAELRDAFPLCALIVVSMKDTPQTVQEIMATGVNGFISKATPPDRMAQVISDILQGQCLVCLDSETEAPQRQDLDISKLSPRQRDVLLRLGQGKTTKEIARELGPVDIQDSQPV